jgi:hypothetical protein
MIALHHVMSTVSLATSGGVPSTVVMRSSSLFVLVFAHCSPHRDPPSDPLSQPRTPPSQPSTMILLRHRLQTAQQIPIPRDVVSFRL